MTSLSLNLECNRLLNAEVGQRAGPGERAACSRVTAPVLIVHGREDPRPLAGVAALADCLPASRLAVIDGAGHQPWRERPDLLQPLLRDFILATGTSAEAAT